MLQPLGIYLEGHQAHDSGDFSKKPQFRFSICGCVNGSSEAVTLQRLQDVDELPILTLCRPTT